MFKKNSGQLTIGEHLIYQNLPEDILARINKLIDWKPFEKILGSLHPAKVGRKAYNPVMMLKILIARRNRGLSSRQKRRNRILSRVRAKVERVFGIFSLHLNRARARYVGLKANEIHLFLTCFTYNMLNLYWRLRRTGVF